MKHLDLFSGIGGFAVAVDAVWNNAEHIFCDNDKFCQQVLKKQFPNSKIYGDIRTITDTRGDEQRGLSGGERKEISSLGEVHLLTGGFPCQPFSTAGKRGGTDDDRFLWPEMFRVIREFKPNWIIAENVAGITNMVEWGEEVELGNQADLFGEENTIYKNQGSYIIRNIIEDIESIGYEIQIFIIPACAVNAPHRRDRVWFVAHTKPTGAGCENESAANKKRRIGENRREGIRQTHKEVGASGITAANPNDSDTSSEGLERGGKERAGHSGLTGGTRRDKRRSWEQNWLEVATELCRVDDGLPNKLDFAGWSKAGHRAERLKSLGNSIVPQVAIEIMKAIKYSNAL